MSTFISIAVSLVVSYLLGAIPFALIIGKGFYKVDLREHGSGNLGATNVFRVLGWKAGVTVLVLDIAKGAAAVAIGHLVNFVGMGPNAQDWVLICAAFAAIAGHSYSPYIKMRGGKGVATAAGALLVLTPKVWPLLVLMFLVTMFASRMVSLASILTACVFPPLTIWLYGDHPIIVGMSFFAAALVLWRHRSNMGRIIRREESKIGRSKEALRAAADAAIADAEASGDDGTGE